MATQNYHTSFVSSEGCVPTSLCSSCTVRNNSKSSLSTSLRPQNLPCAIGTSTKPSSSSGFTKSTSPQPVGKISKGLACGAKLPASSSTAATVVSKPDFEFQLFTSPDCANTVYENNNRTWFFFSISGYYVIGLL